MTENTLLYEQDFYAWTQVPAVLIRDGKLPDLALVALAEEVGSFVQLPIEQGRNRSLIIDARICPPLYCGAQH